MYLGYVPKGLLGMYQYDYVPKAYVPKDYVPIGPYYVPIGQANEPIGLCTHIVMQYAY